MLDSDAVCISLGRYVKCSFLLWCLSYREEHGITTCIMGVHCCLHVNYIIYKHFDWSLHVRSSSPTYVQNIRPVPITFLL